MNLATVARVKLHLGIEGVQHDELLLRLLEAVSFEVAREMDREVQVMQRIEFYDIDRFQQLFRVRAWPIASVAEVSYDAQGEFSPSGTEVLTQFDEWHLLQNGRMGEIQIKTVFHNPISGGLRVTYTGGMATTTNEFMAAYPDITQAVIRQVAYEHQNRHQIGQESFGVGGTSVVLAPNSGLLDSVRTTLNRYRRLTA